MVRQIKGESQIQSELKAGQNEVTATPGGQASAIAEKELAAITAKSGQSANEVSQNEPTASPAAAPTKASAPVSETQAASAPVSQKVAAKTSKPVQITASEQPAAEEASVAPKVSEKPQNQSSGYVMPSEAPTPQEDANEVEEASAEPREEINPRTALYERDDSFGYKSPSMGGGFATPWSKGQSIFAKMRARNPEAKVNTESVYQAMGASVATPPVETISRPDASSQNFYEASKALRKQADNSSTLTNYDKSGSNATIVGDAELGYEEVSVGDEVILSIVRRFPEGAMAKIIEKATGAPLDLALQGNWQQRVNTYFRYNNEPILVEKQPTTQSGDQAAMYLRVHNGAGIKMFPPVAKQFNADFDGDAAKFVTRMKMANGLRTVNDMISMPGYRPSVDEDFFPLPNLDSKSKAQNFTSLIFQDMKVDRAYRASMIEAVRRGDYNLIGQVIRDVVDSSKEKDPRAKERMRGEIMKRIYLCGKDDESKVNLSALVGEDVSIEDPMKDIEVKTAADEKIKEWFHTCLEATLPISWQSLKQTIGANMKWIPGKNYEFRVTADVAKYARNAKYIVFVGDEAIVKGDKGLKELYVGLAEQLYSKMMSGLAADPEAEDVKEATIRRLVRNFDINGNPSPLVPSRFRVDGKINYFLFTKEVWTRYKHYAVIAENASAKVKINSDVSRSSRWSSFTEDFTNSNLSKVMKKVFPELTIGQLIEDPYGKIENFDVYKNRRLDDHAVYNNVYVSSEFAKAEVRENLTAKDLFLIISDQKSSAAGEFHAAYEKATKSLVDTLNSMHRKKILSKNFWLNPGAGDMLKAATRSLFLLGADMFIHYDLTNPRAWVESEVGLELLSCNNAEQLKNLYMQLCFRYRMEKIEEAALRLDADPTNEKLIADYNYTLSKVASSSPIYQAFVDDIRTNGSLFRQARAMCYNSKGQFLSEFSVYKKDGRSYTKKINSSVWKNKEKYNSLSDALFDKTLSYEDKCKLLSDMVKLTTGDVFEESWVEYHITRDKLAVYGNNRYRDRGGYSTILTDIRSIPGSLRAAADFDAACINEINEAIPGQDESHLMAYLGKLASGCETLSYYVKQGFQEAMTTSSVKLYPDGEKSSQQEVISSMYAGQSLAINGETAQDYKAMVDLSYGQIDIEELMKNGVLLAKIFCDPSLEIEAWDTRSGTHVTVSREALMTRGYDESGNPVMYASMKDFFLDNPRIAMALRKRIVVPTDGGDARACNYLTLQGSLMNETEKKDLAFERMSNRPGFFALAAGFCDPTGKTARESSPMYEEGIKRTLHLIARAGDPTCDEQTSIEEIAGEVTPGENGATKLSIPEGIDQEIWAEKMDRCQAHLDQYVEDLAEMAEEIAAATNDQTFSRDEFFKELREATASDMVFAPTYQSFVSIEDTEQMFFGAKTKISTEVNGGMSRELGAASIFMAYEPPACDAPPRIVSLDEIFANEDEYLGCKLADGDIYLDVSLLLELKNSGIETLSLYHSADCTCGGKCCKNHTPHDGSSSRPGIRPVQPLALMFQLIRTDSAEALNLKAKKIGFAAIEALLGDEKYDRIVKYAYDKILKGTDGGIPPRVVKARVNDAYGENKDIVAARIELAKSLQKNFRNFGYPVEGDGDLVGLTYQQLLAISHTMLFETESGVEIVSPRTIAKYINNKFPSTGINSNKKAADVAGQMWAAVATMPVTSEQDRGLLTRLNGVRTEGAYYGTGSSIRKESSSPVRNMSLMMEYVKSGKITYNKQYEDDAHAVFEATRKGLLTFEDEENKHTTVEMNAINHFGNTYNVVSVLDAFRGKEGKKYSSKHILPGAANAMFITGKVTEEQLTTCVKCCRERGITLALDPHYKDHYLSMMDRITAENSVITQHGDGVLIVPFFEMKLNGEANSTATGYANVGVKYIHPERFVRTIAETVGKHISLGDSNMIVTDSFAKKYKVRASGEHETVISDLFAATYEEFDMDEIQAEYGLLTLDEMKRITLNGKDNLYPVDLGLYPDEEAKENFWAAYDAHNKDAHRIEGHNDGSYSISEVYAGDIVGWATMTFHNPRTGKTETRISPVRPYEAGDNVAGVNRFDVERVSYDPMTNSVKTTWKLEQDIKKGLIFKMFEGGHGANKTMVSDVDSASYVLPNGQLVDAFCHFNTTKGRRGGSLLKDCLSSVLVEARTTFGYNIAEDERTFPERPDIRESLKSEPLTISEWQELINEKPIKFYPDNFARANELNKLLNDMVTRCIRVGVNPGIMLASRFDGKQHNLHFNYHSIMDNTPEYQDRMVLWLSLMMPKLISKSGDGTMFRINPDEKDGAVEVKVKFGDKWYWQHIMTTEAFFGDDISALKKPRASDNATSTASLINRVLSGYRPTVQELAVIQESHEASYPTGINDTAIPFSYSFENELGAFSDAYYNVVKPAQKQKTKGGQ